MNHKITSNESLLHTSVTVKLLFDVDAKPFTPPLMSGRFSIEGLLLPRMCPWSSQGFTVPYNGYKSPTIIKTKKDLSYPTPPSQNTDLPDCRVRVRLTIITSIDFRLKCASESVVLK